MKIKYDEENGLLVIKDNLKMKMMLINLVMVVNMINAVLTYFNNSLAGIRTSWYFLLIGVLSAFVFLFSFTRSTLEKVPVDEIDYLIEKRVFGRKRYSLKLKNGKIRNLYIKKIDIPEFERIAGQMNIVKSPDHI